MLELGLRLASKKPTIVIVNRGGTIPFDIRDFHVLSYPADLNILEMEEFFEKLENSIKEKLKSYQDGNYEPFLGNVVVDVLAPESRSLPINELILDRLGEISQQISRSASPSRPVSARIDQTKRINSRIFTNKAMYFYSIPESTVDVVRAKLSEEFQDFHILDRSSDGFFVAGVNEPKTGNEDKFDNSISSFISEIGGRKGVPIQVADAVSSR